MLSCKKCGKPYFPKKFVPRVYERLMEKINPRVKETVSADFKKVEGLCTECRRANSFELDTHTRKHLWLEGA